MKKKVRAHHSVGTYWYFYDWDFLTILKKPTKKFSSGNRFEPYKILTTVLAPFSSAVPTNDHFCLSTEYSLYFFLFLRKITKIIFKFVGFPQAILNFKSFLQSPWISTYFLNYFYHQIMPYSYLMTSNSPPPTIFPHFRTINFSIRLKIWI